jgi:hypothetical protein
MVIKAKQHIQNNEKLAVKKVDDQEKIRKLMLNKKKPFIKNQNDWV